MLEWACIQLVGPHLNWPGEQTVGTHIDVIHAAATPPALHVTVDARLTQVDRRRLTFERQAHDGVDVISSGAHNRAVIDAACFNASTRTKAASLP